MVDKTDKKILNTLLKDCTQSYRKMAAKLGLSPATVMNRVQKLEKKQLIKKYTALVDYEELGYQFHTLIQVRISKGKLYQVENEIATDPHVLAVYDITGHFDAVIIARFKTKNSMNRFVKKIQTYEFIERTQTSLILTTLKEEPISVK